MYFIVFHFIVDVIIKRVKGTLYVSCYYREWLRFLAPICEVKPGGLKTCLRNKDIAG